MSFRIVRKIQIETDVAEIYDYIDQDSNAAAERFLDAFEATIRRLADMPGIGRRWESDSPRLVDLRVTTIPGFRKYLVFYRPLPDAVEFLRVVHGARDVESVLEEGPL